MWGPYREVLLQAGALEVLLEAALAPTQDDNCRKVIEKAAAVGIMYLCTVVRLATKPTMPCSRSAGMCLCRCFATDPFPGSSVSL